MLLLTRAYLVCAQTGRQKVGWNNGAREVLWRDCTGAAELKSRCRLHCTPKNKGEPSVADSQTFLDLPLDLPCLPSFLDLPNVVIITRFPCREARCVC